MGVVDSIEVYNVGPPDADNLLTSPEPGLTARLLLTTSFAQPSTTSPKRPWPDVAKSPKRTSLQTTSRPVLSTRVHANITAMGLDIGCGVPSRPRPVPPSLWTPTQTSPQSVLFVRHRCHQDGRHASKVGDGADNTITIMNTGAVTLYKDDIADTSSEASP
jgi:hypothetical protein